MRHARGLAAPGRWAALVVLSVLLSASPATVAAQASHSCEQDIDGPSGSGKETVPLTPANQSEAGWNAGDPSTALAVADQLDDAWTEGDMTAALALFSDAAVATGPGSHWRGKQELTSFLDRMWHPTYASDVSRFNTIERCATGGRVLWLFDYPETGATGSADMLVQGGLITLISWSYTPAGALRALDSAAGPRTLIETTSRAARGELWAAMASFGILATIGLLRRRPTSADNRLSRQHGHLPSPLHKVTVDPGQRRTP